MLLLSVTNGCYYHYYSYFTISFIYPLTYKFIYLLLSVLCYITYIFCHLLYFSYVCYLCYLLQLFIIYLVVYIFIYLFFICIWKRQSHDAVSGIWFIYLI